MNLVVVFICFLTSLGITEGMSSATGCRQGVPYFDVLLTCNRNEMIHVESKTLYNGSSCTQTLTDKTFCGPPLTDLNNCNGDKTSCNATIFTRTGCQAARVDYRCIKVTEVNNMCEDFNKEDVNNTFFLSTPNYPQISTLTTSAPCTCSIRSSNITSINILYFYLTTAGDATRSDLLINYGDRIYHESNGVTSTVVVVNHYLTTTDLTSLTVQLNHNMKDVQLWMEIQGTGMVVECSQLTTTTPAVPTTTLPSTETDKQSDTFSTNLMLTIVVSLSLLVIVGIFLVILMLCRRGKLLLFKQSGHLNGDGSDVTREGGRVGGRQDGSKGTTESDRNGTTESDRNGTTESDRNIYSELNHSESEPVRDEPYQELGVMNSTPENDNAQNPNYLTVIANSTPDYQDIQNSNYITVM